MRSLIILCLVLGGAQAGASVFTAAKNISEHLAAQENRVGACTDVSIYMTTLRELDGDHEFLGFEGNDAEGRRFNLIKEYGVDGSRPRVLRKAAGEYLVFIAVGTGFGERRDEILTMRTDGEGRVITDLIAPDGRRLCQARIRE